MALIINDKMPDACWDCDYRCGLNILGTGQKKHECCPILGEISDEHGRLIDADFFEKYAIRVNINGKEYIPADYIKIVPTVLEASK